MNTKSQIKVLAAAAALLLTTTIAQAQGTITDVGGTPGPSGSYQITGPTPGPNDIYFISYDSTWDGFPSSSDTGKAYYDTDNWPYGYSGQTFTTGTNPDGYNMTSLTFETSAAAGASENLGTASTYTLWIYAVSSGGASAAPLGSYTATGTINAGGDWMVWSALPIILYPNTEYAYAIGQLTPGAEECGLACNEGAAPFTSYQGTWGEAVQILAGGGTIGYPNPFTSANFDIGLTIRTSPPPVNTNPPVAYAPSYTNTPPPSYTLPVLTNAPPIVVGATITLSETTTGATSYAWLCDNGTAGLTFTPVGGATGSNLVVNTTGFATNSYEDEVVVSNSYGANTSAPVTLNVLAPFTGPLLDIGGSDGVEPTPGANDAYYFSWAATWENFPATSDSGHSYYDCANNGQGNNNGFSGQVFTTGTNPGGYMLTSVSVQSTANSYCYDNLGQLEPYTLWIYSVSSDGTTATLVDTYNATGSINGPGEWFKWTGLNDTLTPNTSYAYAIGQLGWIDNNAAEQCGLACDEVYSNNAPTFLASSAGVGQAACILYGGGPILYSTVDGGNNPVTAVFDVGLTAVGSAPPVTLYIAKSGMSLSLTWSSGTLLQATTVAGPWTTASSTSPYLVSPTGSQMFYKVKVQ